MPLHQPRILAPPLNPPTSPSPPPPSPIGEHPTPLLPTLELMQKTTQLALLSAQHHLDIVRSLHSANPKSGSAARAYDAARRSLVKARVKDLMLVGEEEEIGDVVERRGTRGGKTVRFEDEVEVYSFRKNARVEGNVVVDLEEGLVARWLGGFLDEL